MPRVLTVGNIHRASTLLDRITFPVLDLIEAIGCVTQALRDAVQNRTGVLVTGPTGAGKSIALEQAYHEFGAAEIAKRRNDATHRVRSVVKLGPIAPETRSELIRELYRREFGALPGRVSRDGDSALLDQVIEAWAERNVAAVCFDEAEAMSTKALGVCRDIISISASHAGKVDANRFKAAGIGVVLLGTSNLSDRLRRTRDYGERWTTHLEIGGLPDAVLPEVYRAYLPAFDTEAQARGAQAWTELIAGIAPLVHGSGRRLENHVRAYISTYLDNTDRLISEVEEIGFDETIFQYAIESLADTAEPEHEAA